MEVQPIREGLWRWLLPHPAWTPDRDRPGGWGRMVGSVYFESPDALVLIDPLVPAERDPDAPRFWKALDRDVARLARPIVVLVGGVDHGRSADRIAERYRERGVEVLGSRRIRGEVACTLTGTVERSTLPGGVEAHEVAGFVPGETAYLLRRPRAIVFADAVIGTGEGRLAVAPVSWAPRTPAGRKAYAGTFRESVARIAGLGPSIVLPSHGAPVLAAGARALRRALAAPAWGD